MVIGAMHCELMIDGSWSLKDKRRVVQSLIARTRSRHNVAIAEVGDQDVWNRALIGIVCVTNDSAHAYSMLEAVARALDQGPDAVLERYEIEIL
ncbi:MAG: DUF503 domain-containing protein [Firmicutes bacterium]|jgi:uncharacterized protein YlxP (DUF503 family)|nr:DUF503 domain-containing protein [Bacillota bacterium]